MSKRKYYSYHGTHYEFLKEEIGKLTFTLRFMGNENPMFNYLEIYRVFKDSGGNYTVTRNIDNILLSKPPEEVGSNELELTIVRDLIKNPWATAPCQYVPSILEIEGSISFLNTQKKHCGDELTSQYYAKVISTLYANLMELSNLPPESYLYGSTVDMTKSICPNKWQYVKSIRDSITSKSGYESWGTYIESLLLHQGHLTKPDEEENKSMFDYEIELLAQIFNIDLL